MVMMICPKGSHGFGGYSTKCERDVKGTCMWRVVPPSCCTVEDCGKAPKLPKKKCLSCPRSSHGGGCYDSNCG